MRVFVTGGNGFVGSAVVRHLIAAGHAPRLLLRTTSRLDRIAGLDFERVDGDVRDPAAVLVGATGCDAVVHLAGLSSWDEISSPLMEQVVMGGVRNVLAAAVANRPRPLRVVFVSSILAVAWSHAPHVFDESAAFPGSDARLSYSRWKRAAEAACMRAWKDDGVPVVIVNPGEIYGADDTDRITAGNLLDFARSNPVFVSRGGTLVAARDDVAAGIVAALEAGRPGERYILGGENLSIRDLAATFLELLGESRRIIELPNTLLSGIGAIGRAIPIPLPFNPEVIPYATRFWWMDSSKAQRDLGVSFRSARESLRPAVDWLRATGALPGPR